MTKIVQLLIMIIIMTNGCSLPPKTVQSIRQTENFSLSKIRVLGNQLVDQNSIPVRLKGLNPVDPLIHKYQGDSGCPDWGKKYFDMIKQWGANVVRLSVHPGVWKHHGDQATLVALDEAINWCQDNKMYVIIDLHSIGFPTQGIYKNDFDTFYGNKYATAKQEIKDFWKMISQKYRGQTIIAGYEIFNEPTVNPNNESNPEDLAKWQEFKNFVQEVVEEIRKNDQETIIIVGGLSWAYNLSYVNSAPIEGKQIAYAVHPYPDKTDWDSNFGNICNEYPVIVTEFGYTSGNPAEHFDESNYSGNYGEQIIHYLNTKNLSWIAWNFSTSWKPQLLQDIHYTPSKSGEFFKKHLLN